MKLNTILKAICGSIAALCLLLAFIGAVTGAQGLVSVGVLGLVMFGLLFGLLFVKRAF
jgi:hypothetical protein